MNKWLGVQITAGRVLQPRQYALRREWQFVDISGGVSYRVHICQVTFCQFLYIVEIDQSQTTKSHIL